MRVFNLQGEQVLYQRSHEDWPRATVFTVDGKHLISASRDRTVKLIEVATERFIDTSRRLRRVRCEEAFKRWLVTRSGTRSSSAARMVYPRFTECFDKQLE